MFLDDIVDTGVLPYLSLAVDGLTARKDSSKRQLELRPEEGAANEDVSNAGTIPTVILDPEQLEVYGWESSWWRKLRGYIGL